MSFSIKISGKRFDFFNNFVMTLRYNSVASTFSFNALYDPDNEDHRTLFRPASYRRCDIFNENELLLTGVILNHKFTTEPERQLTGISGYSVTGRLDNSSIPIAAYPLETSNLSLSDISTNILSFFGLNVEIDPNALANARRVILKTTSSPGASVTNYLNSIAKQNNLVLSHTNDGRLLITKPVSNSSSIGTLTDRDITKAEFSINGQSMHHEITLQKQGSIFEDDNTERSIQNPFVTNFVTDVNAQSTLVSNFSPIVKEQTSGTAQNTDEALQNMLSAELSNMKLTIQYDNWFINQSLIKPGQIISVQSDRLFLRNKADFFIESVTFKGTPDKQIVTINCVLPEVYTSGTPTNIFL